MNFIKKNMALIVPSVIMLVAIILIVLSIMINSTVKKGMDSSFNLARKVDVQIRKTPSQRQAKIEQEYQDKHEADKKKIESLVKASSLRELISYDVFPEPRDSSRQIFKDFGDKYQKAIEELLEKMNAGDAPSQKELDIASSVTNGRNRSRRSDSSAVDPIEDAICKKRASQIRVYAAPDVFSWYNVWKEYRFAGQDDAVKKCWDSQIAFWVYEDIADTIASMNADSKSVFDSPVKKLVGISFTHSVGKSDGRMSDSDTPTYVTSDSSVGIGEQAWTNRKCDKFIDVIHFSVSFIVAADKVSELMKELCSEKSSIFKGWSGKDAPKDYKHNQITILSCNIAPVIRDSASNQRYRYGSSAVVKWTAVCEYVFLRDTYDVIKPKQIKELFEQDK